MTRLNSLIRPQPWINWLIVAAGVGLWAASVWVGWTVDRSESGLKEVLGLRAGKLPQLFGAAYLLGATQLSLVTFWYRTHSRKDFQGRYRVWIWSSLIWGVLFSAAISGWHLSGSEWLARQVPGRLQPAAGSAWLLAATILVATATRLLSQEMARARSTIWLLRAAQLAAAVTLVLQLEPGLVPSGITPELQAGLASFWPLLMASALLQNARYVIHVSNEVAPSCRRASRLSPVLQQVWAEVLSIGPSRTKIASSLSPQSLCRVAVGGWKRATAVVLAIVRLRRRTVDAPGCSPRIRVSSPKRRECQKSPVPAPN